MRERHVLKWGLVLTVLTVVAVLWIDRPLAEALAPSARGMHAVTGPAVDVLEIVFGFPVSKFLTGAVLLIVALTLFAFPRYRAAAWVLLFVSLSQLTARLLAGVLKNVFLRPRPWEAVERDEWQFFTDGSSFPSGHAAHFWPFFFAAVVAFPRWRIPLLVLAVFVSASRVAVNDHFAGDVLASAVIAAFVTWGYARGLRRRLSAGTNAT